MQVAVSVVADAAGRKSATLTFTSDDAILRFTCCTDANGCRALAALLVQQADLIEKRIITINRETGCPMCNGESQEYEREPVPLFGTWVHRHIGKPDQTMFCLDSPLKPPPVSAA